MQASWNVSILSIGTELTTGQIVNSNAQWISRQLHRAGLPVRAHVTVPDLRESILEAMDHLSRRSQVIFITGGLGPTSDDITRAVVSEWLKQPLEFHPPSWEHIQSLLLPRGIPLREAQKQQCLFPQGAQILVNTLGTANAFRCERQDLRVFVLPGPPKELMGLWEKDIAPEILLWTQQLDPWITSSWDTLGLGESEIAHRVEEVTADCPFEKGYRVHLPYVEVKLIYSKSRQEEARFWKDRIEQVLSDCIISRDGSDVAELLGQHLALKDAPIWIEDQVTGVALWSRLQGSLRELIRRQQLAFTQFESEMNSVQKVPTTWFLQIAKHSQTSVEVRIQRGESVRHKLISAPTNSPILLERQNQYFAEMAMIFWHISLQEFDAFE